MSVCFGCLNISSLTYVLMMFYLVQVISSSRRWGRQGNPNIDLCFYVARFLPHNLCELHELGSEKKKIILDSDSKSSIS